MTEIQLTFFSLNNLFDKFVWNSFLSIIEKSLGEKLSHLDIKDPVREKVTDIESAVDFICTPDNKTNNRWLFGKFGRSKVEFSLSLFRDKVEFPNNISFYFPGKLLLSDKGIQAIVEIFKFGNEYLNPFYSYGDELEQIAAKKKSTGMSVDLEVELVGMFWLTHFNNQYMEFFGGEKLDLLASLNANLNVNGSGVTLKLGELPASSESIALRTDAEKMLGAESFVDPNLSFDRLKGPQALTYNQLRGRQEGTLIS